MGVDGISTQGRNTQGVRLISLKESDEIADVSRVIIDEEEEGTEENGEAVAQEGSVEENGEAASQNGSTEE